jgi:molecular chaperone GrpE
VDPHLHEVVKHLKSDKDDGLIVEEVQKGYFVHDQVLRPAKVIITKVNDHG